MPAPAASRGALAGPPPGLPERSGQGVGGAEHQGEGHAGEETGNQTVTSTGLESRGPTHVSPVYAPQCSPLLPGSRLLSA